jgi:hypothetical protein
MTSLGKVPSISPAASASSSFGGLCTPAIVNIVLSCIMLLATIMSMEASGLDIIGQLIYIGVFTWLLNFLCKSGYSWVAWILLFLPVIILVLLFIGFAVLIKASGK